jgi:hypothetical protein
LAISHYFSYAPRERAGQLGFQAENCEPGGTETRWNSAKKVLLSATQKHVDISLRRVVLGVQRLTRHTADFRRVRYANSQTHPLRDSRETK